MKFELINFFQDKGKWINRDSHRVFFENYAKQHNFDFRVPENWYSLLRISRQHKGIVGILKYNKYDLSQAIVKAFPDINFDQSKFVIGMFCINSLKLIQMLI